jgi:hypothetical protein
VSRITLLSVSLFWRSMLLRPACEQSGRELARYHVKTGTGDATLSLKAWVTIFVSPFSSLRNLFVPRPSHSSLADRRCRLKSGASAKLCHVQINVTSPERSRLLKRSLSSFRVCRRI